MPPLTPSPSLPSRIALSLHPDSRCEAVHRLEVCFTPALEEELGLAFILDGNIERLRVPAPGRPRPGTDLWRHTCCELFIRGEGQAGYCEFNLAPSGAWAAYAFTDYREGGPLTDGRLCPRVTATRTPDRLRLDALIPVGRIAALAGYPRMSVALSAVIEDERGELSYWALAHPPGRPDFHHRYGFAVALERTAQGASGETTARSR